MKIHNIQKYDEQFFDAKYSGTWTGLAKLHGDWVELFAPLQGYNEYEAKAFMRHHQITRKAWLPSEDK